MRDLTIQGRKELEKRQARFESFLNERMPVLTEFAEALELADARMIVADPERYLPSIDEFMRDQVVAVDDRAWIITRLGYLIGEVLVQRLGGCWLLNEVPDTRYFLRYVVGQFTRLNNQNAMLDPFEVASALVDQPRGRALAALVNEVAQALRGA